MSRLLYSAAASLDGFIAGPDGDMQWLTPYLRAEPHAYSVEIAERTGAILLGAGTFRGDDPNRGSDRSGAFGGLWQGPCVVLTHDVPADRMEGVEFRSDFESAVASARAAAGDKDVSVLGADVARQCLAAGVLDEIIVFDVPILLGGGTRLFPGEGSGPVPLQITKAVADDAGTATWYSLT